MMPHPVREKAQFQTGVSKSSLYTMIDLFVGCGGLSLGFEEAGFSPIFVNELNHDAMATYLQNRRHELGGLAFAENQSLRCHDAHELKGKRLKELVSDLANIPEANFIPSEKTDSKHGGGSTLDIITGGPPCQGYSGIGIRRSYSVDRKDIPSNHLFRRMAKIVGQLRPRIFLFENVRGLLNARWKKTSSDSIFFDVKAEFRRIAGYEVRWSLVYSKDYGVPQNRPRVLLVGIRKDIVSACQFIEPNADAEDAVRCGFLPKGEVRIFPDLVDLLDDLVDPKATKLLGKGELPKGRFETTSYPREAHTSIQKYLRRPNPWDSQTELRLTEHEYSKHKPSVVDKFNFMLQNNGEIPAQYKTRKFSQRVLKARWGNGEPNMSVTSVPDDYVHYSQPRVLTVREWARLQLFPDWYQFSGKRTTGGLRRAGNPQEGLFDREVPKYTQIGNAVPVGLAERVGRHFKKILDAATGSR